MGRRDAMANNLPVDTYRKQIGKQNKKQTTSDVKILRKHTEQKSSTPKLYQDMKVMIGIMMAVVLCVYISLFIWLYR